MYCSRQGSCLTAEAGRLLSSSRSSLGRLLRSGPAGACTPRQAAAPNSDTPPHHAAIPNEGPEVLKTKRDIFVFYRGGCSHPSLAEKFVWG